MEEIIETPHIKELFKEDNLCTYHPTVFEKEKRIAKKHLFR